MIYNGFVGFFDILGYQNIIDNNDLSYTSELIKSIFMKMPDKVSGRLMLYSNEDNVKDRIIKVLNNAIKSELISDSMLISLKLNSVEDYSDNFALGVFCIYIAEFTREMFFNGLPIRGCIDVGDYFLDEKCFAGKPIINAYRWAESLDFSGVVLSKEADIKINSLLGEDYYQALFLKYLTPLKLSDQDLVVLKWYSPNINIVDIRNMVHKAFIGHNKGVNESIQNKLLNTELSIRAMIASNK
jgi:hypothetical protein